MQDDPTSNRPGSGSAAARSPLVIGGVGGSGTRLYRTLAVTAGYEMLVAPLPQRLLWRAERHDNDTMARFFYDAWIDPYLTGRIGPRELERMKRRCRWLLWLCGPFAYGRGRWGWKNPRAMFLLPFFKAVYPTMRYIHVVRDGRNHAFHPKFPYRAHQTAVLETGALDQADHVRKALFWQRSNQIALTAMHDHLPDTSIVSRFEDLCHDPEREVRRVMQFLGRDDPEIVDRARSLVRVPASIDRWTKAPAEQIAEVEAAIGSDLVRLGYDLVTGGAPAAAPGERRLEAISPAPEML